MAKQEYISIVNSRVHNLKNVSVKIPRGKMTVVTGISGSGKSSLAFDTLFAEGQRRYLESLSSFARQFLGALEKPDVDRIDGLSPTLSIDQKTTVRSPRSTVGTMSEVYDLIRLMYSSVGVPYCEICGQPMVKQLFDTVKSQKNSTSHWQCEKGCGTFPEVTISTFSFNSPLGACSSCHGLGKRLEVDTDEVMPNPRLTLAEGAIRPWQRINVGLRFQKDALNNLLEKYNISWDKPVGELTVKQREIVLNGDDELLGVAGQIKNRYDKTDSDFIRRELEKFMVEKVCFDCQGGRLKKSAISIKVAGKNILEFTTLTIEKIHGLFSALKSGQEGITENELLVAGQLIDEILKRLGFLKDVGLGYLTLDRNAQTLSGGEAQRIRLASQLGSQLVGVTYILDEPSIGLHPKDHLKLLNSLEILKSVGNTVVVVEHDRDTIEKADYIIDVGPGAGTSGGKIVVAGTLEEVLKSEKSLTALYLTGKEAIPVPNIRRTGNGTSIAVLGSSGFNLQDIDVQFPLEKLICVTGVSGSGKSTLIHETLAKALSAHFHRAKSKPAPYKKIIGLENLDKVIFVDQSPIGRNIRSNPATYTGVFEPIREVFASQPQAEKLKLNQSHFSFNLKGGRCETCKGDGVIKFEMHFLPNVFVTCETCKGERYIDKILTVRYKRKTISDVLNMTVVQASNFFADNKEIVEKLEVLQRVGLGYMKLGQPATELSGGEAQRVKLATELARPSTGKTLYILDEPTSGLHFDDIKRLLGVLHALVDRGNTVLVVEHNMDVINNADWVIDLGPGGGEAGGKLVAEGTPEQVANNKDSVTGQYLKKNK